MLSGENNIELIFIVLFNLFGQWRIILFKKNTYSAQRAIMEELQLLVGRSTVSVLLEKEISSLSKKVHLECSTYNIGGLMIDCRRL